MTQTKQPSELNWFILLAAWSIAAGSTLGSIFFSHVMEFAPCVLCWYQRICLFPLVVVLAMGLFPFDKAVIKYALPLTICGWLVAAYHTLLYSGIIPQEMQPCTKGVSCTEKYIEFFGFLSIPMLSLMGFSVLIALLLLLKKRTA